MNQNVSIHTVQDHIDQSYTVTVYCHNPRCHRRAMLDLVEIRRRFGSEQSLMFDDIKYKLRCKQCGGKEVGMTMSPPTMARGGAGRRASRTPASIQGLRLPPTAAPGLPQS
jgi:hypothetical protein